MVTSADFLLEAPVWVVNQDYTFLLITMKETVWLKDLFKTDIDSNVCLGRYPRILKRGVAHLGLKRWWLFVLVLNGNTHLQRIGGC